MRNLENCYNQLREIVGNIEPYESVALVEKYRQYWKPEKVRIILLAESHVRTSREDWSMPVRKLDDLPNYPTNYAKFVYCLAYGEKQLTNSQTHPKRDGTPQFWKIFCSCDNRITDKNDFSPILTRTPDEQRLENKIKLLKSLRRKGIWLVDSSIVALYNNGEKPKNMREVIGKSWESYTRDVVKEANPEYIICIGKTVERVLRDDIYELVGKKSCDVILQPNARLSSEKHMENFRKCSEICCEICC